MSRESILLELATESEWDGTSLTALNRDDAAVTGQRHPAHDDRTPLGDGWATVVRLVAAR